MRILLIGGAGFIGSHTALRLLSEGHEPFILDCLDPQVHGDDPHSSPTVRSLAGKVEISTGDSRDPRAVAQALERAEAVLYLPAATGTGQSMYQIEHYCDVNVRAAGVFAEVLGRFSSRLSRIVVSSTRAVYGEGAAMCAAHGRIFSQSRQAKDLSAGQFESRCPHCGEPVSPLASLESDPGQPHSIYGITKLAQEQVISQTARNLGIPCVVFRYQNVYGPGQSARNPYTGILTIFTQLALAGREINLFEDGRSTRDFVHVDDIAECNARSLEVRLDGAITLNAGSGRRLTLADCVAALETALQRPVRRQVSGQFRLGDVRHAAADCTALRRTLGFGDFRPFAEGLRDFAEWMTGQGTAGETPERFERSLKEMREAGMLRGPERQAPSTQSSARGGQP